MTEVPRGNERLDHISPDAVDLKQRQIPPAVLKYIPETLARRHRVIPVDLDGTVLIVAMADPDDL